MHYNDTQLAFLIQLRQEGKSWNDVAKAFNKKFGENKTYDSLRLTYDRHKHLYDISDDSVRIDHLREIARSKKASSKTVKENRLILSHLNKQEDLLESIKSAIQSIKLKPIKLNKPKKSQKTPMTMELLISDVHIGKKGFSVKTCENRLTALCQVMLAEITRMQRNYKVEKIIIGFLGDNIENALMHGRESAIGCEFENPEQVRLAIELFYSRIIKPLAETGLEIDCIFIAGNHDREEPNKTYQDPSKNSLNWIIAKTIDYIGTMTKMTNVNFILETGAFTHLDVYGNTIVYEHGDHIKGNSKAAFLTHIAKRGAQLNKVVRGVRLGHWHEYACYGSGIAIVNGSVCGQDSYAKVNGYNTEAGQVINYYVKTPHRESSFYHSFLVQLEHIK